HRLGAANEVGREPAGGDEQVEIVGRAILRRLVALRGIAQFARIRLPRLGADPRNLAARLLEAGVRVPNFKCLVLLLDEDRGACVGQIHDVTSCWWGRLYAGRWHREEK